MPPSIHRLDDADDRLLARWKASRLTTYFEHVRDDEGLVVFTDGAFTMKVPAARGAVPIFDAVTRETLEAFLTEYENGVGATTR